MLDQPTIFKDPRKAAYLNPEGAERALKSPIGADVVDAARRYRLGRLRDQLIKADVAAILLYDPCNIRYALDCPNMQVWTLHNAARYALIFAEGPAIMFDFHGCEHLGAGIPTIDEIRTSICYAYFSAGDHMDTGAKRFAGEIAALVAAHGGGNRAIAIDRIEAPGLHALAAAGLRIVEGQPLAEQARSVKNAAEVTLMRWTIRVAEAAMARMYEASLPGITERELWAILHHENARSGGDWLETKLVTSGPRTNPWYQECSDREVLLGEMISFDTDMIGPYGYCADLSRSWVCGHVAMRPEQRALYARAREQIEHNLALLKPGLSFAEFNARQWTVPEENVPYRYSIACHGVGMADEWPFIPLAVDYKPDYQGHFEEGQVICVESLMAASGTESVKLETQALIGPNGAERLDSFPWEEV